VFKLREVPQRAAYPQLVMSGAEGWKKRGSNPLHCTMVSTFKVRIFNAGEVNMEILVEIALAVLR
jgi:hypothetical protein